MLEGQPPETAFFLGMITGVIAYVFIRWIMRLRQQNKLLDKAASEQGNMRELQEQTALLLEENGMLKNLVTRNDDRIAVLERIATDPGQRTAQEIDALR